MPEAPTPRTTPSSPLTTLPLSPEPMESLLLSIHWPSHAVPTTPSLSPLQCPIYPTSAPLARSNIYFVRKSSGRAPHSLARSVLSHALFSHPRHTHTHTQEHPHEGPAPAVLRAVQEKEEKVTSPAGSRRVPRHISSPFFFLLVWLCSHDQDLTPPPLLCA